MNGNEDLLQLHSKLNELFDETWYLNQYPDVRESGLEPFWHYMNHGWREMRDPHPLFSTAWYLQNNLDVRNVGLNPFEHYIMSGWKEFRSPHEFISETWFQAKYASSDKCNSSKSALENLIEPDSAKWGIDPNPFFSSKYVINQLIQKTPRASSVDAITAFLADEDNVIRPNSWFDEELFMTCNSEVKQLVATGVYSNGFQFLVTSLSSSYDVDNVLRLVVTDVDGRSIDINQDWAFDPRFGIKREEAFSPIYRNGFAAFSQLVNEEKVSTEDFKVFCSDKYPNVIVRDVMRTKEISTRGIAIFCTYDPFGHFSDGVVESINNLIEIGLSVLIVTKSNIDSVPEQIRDSCIGILQRETSGSDIEGYLLGLKWIHQNFPKFDKDLKVVLTNDSVFVLTPFLESLTKSFEQLDFDVWGATSSDQKQKHIQSYFLVMSSMAAKFASDWLESELGKWWNLTKNGLIRQVEIPLLSAFLKEGYTCGAMVSPDMLRRNESLAPSSLAILNRFDSQLSIPVGCNPSVELWEDLLVLFDFPFLKVEAVNLLISKYNGENAAMQYLNFILKDATLTKKIVEHSQHTRMSRNLIY
jgi:hypothetical protein